LPFLANGQCKPGKISGDISFKMDNAAVGAVMTAVRYVCLLALYGGIGVVIYSIYVIEHPDGKTKTPEVSPAMHCVITLTVQYFLIYIILCICMTAKSFMSPRGQATDDWDPYNEVNEDGSGNVISTRDDDDTPSQRGMTKAISIFDAARSTVMFAPMLSILFIGARMRALQLTKAKNGIIPADAGPQKWVQDGMFLATWSVFVQLIMTMLVPILTGAKAETAKDGSLKVPSGTNKSLAIVVEVVRYLSLLCMYGGACVVMYGVFVMTPNTLPPYSQSNLVPGLEIPNPPAPVEDATSLTAWSAH